MARAWLGLASVCGPGGWEQGDSPETSEREAKEVTADSLDTVVGLGSCGRAADHFSPNCVDHVSRQ